jgi:hypothetical protein
LWLRGAASLAKPTSPAWLRLLVRAYSEWTAVANGAGLASYDRLDDVPSQWNDAYYHVLARSLPALSDSEINGLALAPLIALPDEPFFDIVTHFLRDVDAVYFNERALQDSQAIRLRSALAQRLIATGGFRSLAGKRAASIEVHLGPAIAAFFFNDYGFLQPAKAYLFAQAMGRLAPFLPELATLAAGAPCPFVAILTLNLVEVSPRSDHLPFIVTAASAWMATFPNDSIFWGDLAIGRRVCALIDAIRLQQPTLFTTYEPLRRQLEHLLAALIRCGVAEASRLEQVLIRDT